jgi:hypothetical protein
MRKATRRAKPAPDFVETAFAVFQKAIGEKMKLT